MEGSDEPQSRGMIPRAVETIFKSLEEQSKLVSFRVVFFFYSHYTLLTPSLLVPGMGIHN